MARKKIVKNKLHGTDFQYSAEINYSTYHPCRNGSNCCDGDYCRCGEINDARVTQVPNVLDKLWPDESEENRYCIDRILSFARIWNVDNWDVGVCRGYYGQEIDGVTFSHSGALVVDERVDALLALETLKEKVEYVLTLEYGHVLDSIKNKNWVIKNVPKNEIVFGQTDYYKKLDQDVVSYYKNQAEEYEHELPRGVCLQVEPHIYRVIDGYHRLSGSEGSVRIICGQENQNE